MSKKRTTEEAANMATATMKGVNNPSLWEHLCELFELGMTQEDVNIVLRELRNNQGGRNVVAPKV